MTPQFHLKIQSKLSGLSGDSSPQTELQERRKSTTDINPSNKRNPGTQQHLLLQAPSITVALLGHLNVPGMLGDGGWGGISKQLFIASWCSKGWCALLVCSAFSVVHEIISSGVASSWVNNTNKHNVNAQQLKIWIQGLVCKSPATPHDALDNREAQMKKQIQSCKKKITTRECLSTLIYGAQTTSKERGGRYRSCK